MMAATYRRLTPPWVVSVMRPTPKDSNVLIWLRASSVRSGNTRISGPTNPGIAWFALRLMLSLVALNDAIAGMGFANEAPTDSVALKTFVLAKAMLGMKWLYGIKPDYTMAPADAGGRTTSGVTCRPWTSA